MSVEEQVTALSVMVEHRMTAIEGEIKSLATSIDHWAQHTKTQNGRIDQIEGWIAARVQDLAHAAGVVQGRAQLRSRDVAVLAGVAAAISVLSALSMRAVDIYRLITG